MSHYIHINTVICTHLYARYKGAPCGIVIDTKEKEL